MAGLAEALNGAVADIAANAGDDGDRPAAVDQYRSLLDMGLEEEPDPARIDERFACRHQVDRDADGGHGFAERVLAIAAAGGECLRAKAAEQGKRGHIGLPV